MSVSTSVKCASPSLPLSLPRRRGVTLLEVLFSIFVLSVGLLGLFAMVPVGTHQVAEAAHADGAAACGQAALAEFKVRDMADPQFWTNRTSVDKSGMTSTFMLDPLSVTSNNNATYDYFPYNGSASFPYMERLTLRREVIPNTTPPTYVNLTASTCERIFSWSDDRIFDIPDDDTSRPRMLVDAANNALPTSRQSAGNFTWTAMVTPAASGLVKVAIVVFHKRDMVYDSTATAAGERMVYCDMPGGGGDVVLRVPNTYTQQEAEELLKVRAHHWILLAGELLPNASGLYVHKWYRVVTTSQVQATANDWTVDVTLAGPDWDPTKFIDKDSANGNTAKTMRAMICDGVVGVFEKTVQLDEPSLWTTH